MKSLIVIIIMVIMIACNANKKITDTENLSESSSICPSEGTCTLEVLKDKFFNIKTDEFGNSYPELIDGNKIVLKFSYNKNTITDVEDDHYSEVVYLEFEEGLSSINLKNKDLSSVKAGFSRVCFCRGQTGTFPINIGHLNLSKLTDSTYQIIFDFTITEVPQVINSFDRTFKL